MTESNVEKAVLEICSHLASSSYHGVGGDHVKRAGREALSLIQGEKPKWYPQYEKLFK